MWSRRSPPATACCRQAPTRPPGDVLSPGRRAPARGDLAAFAVLGRGQRARSASRAFASCRRSRDADRDRFARSSLLARSAASRVDGGDAPPDRAGLEGALAASRRDAIILIGGSGTGRRDRSVRELAQLGRVAFHGVGAGTRGDRRRSALSRTRPVLIVPGRLDAALAVWLTLGRRMLARLRRTQRRRARPSPWC